MNEATDIKLCDYQGCAENNSSASRLVSFGPDFSNPDFSNRTNSRRSTCMSVLDRNLPNTSSLQYVQILMHSPQVNIVIHLDALL